MKNFPNCIKCNKKLNNYNTKFCRKCFLESIKSPNKFCKDCGIKIKRYDAIRCLSCCHKGKLNHNFGKKHSNKTKRKMSQNHPDISGSKNPNWKNGIKVSQGYIYIYLPNHPNNKKNYIKKANLVIEKKIKRYLKKAEVIHHKDKNKQNDCISNLVLCKNESEHQRKYHKIHFTKGT